MKTLTIYGVAVNPEGRLGQVMETRVVSGPGVVVSKSRCWTGVVYKTEREAIADSTRMNAGGAR